MLSKSIDCDFRICSSAVSIAVANAGKHVLVEKPVGVSEGDVAQMVAARELHPGDELKGCEVLSAHNNKLFLAVPVVRRGKLGAPTPPPSRAPRTTARTS